MNINHILAEVRRNRAKLDGCPRHFFTATTAVIGQRLECAKCGGTMSLMDIGTYIRGYEAGGRSAADIWPEYAKKREEKWRNQ